MSGIVARPRHLTKADSTPPDGSGDSRRAVRPAPREIPSAGETPSAAYPFAAARRGVGPLTALLLKTATSILQNIYFCHSITTAYPCQYKGGAVLHRFGAEYEKEVYAICSPAPCGRPPPASGGGSRRGPDERQCTDRNHIRQQRRAGGQSAQRGGQRLPTGLFRRRPQLYTAGLDGGDGHLHRKNAERLVRAAAGQHSEGLFRRHHLRRGRGLLPHPAPHGLRLLRRGAGRRGLGSGRFPRLGGRGILCARRGLPLRRSGQRRHGGDGGGDAGRHQQLRRLGGQDGDRPSPWA